MSAGGYDTPHISPSFSRYDSWRSSGNIHSSYDVSMLFVRLGFLNFLTFIFSRGLFHHAVGPLHPDRRGDLMIAIFQNVLNHPSGIHSPLSIGRIIIDLVPLVGLVAHQARIIMNLQHDIQTQTTGSALLHGGARLLWRSS
jgi:hypothetical protein